jgi:hypothetical protein
MAASLAKVSAGLPETGLSSAAAMAHDDPALARSFLRGISQSQMFSRLLQRHTSIYLGSYHALCATLSSSPTLSDSRSWLPAQRSPSHTLVIPPPGWPVLAPWQIRTDGTRLLPHPSAFQSGVGAAGKSASGASERKSRKRDKRDEVELARKWTTGEVSAALGLSNAEAVQLVTLVTRAGAGDMGPHGDDVGGTSEGADTTASETAALLSAAAAAVGSEANPVTGSSRSSRQRAPRKVLKQPSVARAPRSRFGIFGGSTGGAAAAATLVLDDTSIAERICRWLQQTLVTWSTLGGTSAMMVQGVWWSHDDDRVLSLFSSRAARAGFVRVLQSQVLLSCGAGNPEYGAVAGAQVHMQPLLKPGSTLGGDVVAGGPSGTAIPDTKALLMQVMILFSAQITAFCT